MGSTSHLQLIDAAEKNPNLCSCHVLGSDSPLFLTAEYEGSSLGAHAATLFTWMFPFGCPVVGSTQAPEDCNSLILPTRRLGLRGCEWVGAGW